MNFGQAIGTALSKYAVFSGRARRSEYWFFFLFNVVLSIAAGVADVAAGTQVIGLLVTLAFLLPGLAVGVRRLHDTGRTGWWLLIAFVPLLGAITLIVFNCQDSDDDNRYGPSPKALPTHAW